MHKVKDNKIFIFSSIYILFVKSISKWLTIPMFSNYIYLNYSTIEITKQQENKSYLVSPKTIPGQV